MDVELRHLRAFEAVAAARSFTAASAHLLITQPALTRTIQQLEAAVGVRLLERTTRTVELTAAGARFLARVQPVLAELDLALAEARDDRELRLGFSWVLPDPWASTVIAHFEAAAGASVRLARRDDVEGELLAGSLDAGLIHRRPRAAALAHLLILTEPRMAAVSATSSLADAESLAWEALAEHPLVVNTVSGAVGPELWPEGARPSRVIECANYDEWIALIAAGRGVGATPMSAATGYAHSGVRFIPLEGAPNAELHLAWVPKGVDPLVRTFAEIAVAVG